MSRLRRTLDPEHRAAAEQRWHLVTGDDMEVIRRGLNAALAGRFRALTGDEGADLQLASMRADLAMAEGAATLETLVRRQQPRRGGW